MLRFVVAVALLGTVLALPQLPNSRTTFPSFPHASLRVQEENRPLLRSSVPRDEPTFVPIIPKTPTIVRRTEAEREIDDEESEILYEQNKNAKYSFDSQITDNINDGSITRKEERDGLALKGMYSYSDGFFRRTVHYEADEDGYRVIKEEIEPIGDGPKFNPKGNADVHSSLTGSYSITGDDIPDVRDREELRRRQLA